jgi:hypothetical protein
MLPFKSQKAAYWRPGEKIFLFLFIVFLEVKISVLLKSVLKISHSKKNVVSVNTSEINTYSIGHPDSYFKGK